VACGACKPDDFTIAGLVTDLGHSIDRRTTTSGASFVGASGTGRQNREQRGGLRMRRLGMFWGVSAFGLDLPGHSFNLCS
jgi:hypothetical protein